MTESGRPDPRGPKERPGPIYIPVCYCVGDYSVKVRIKQEGFIRMLIFDFKGRYRFVAPKSDQKKIFGRPICLSLAVCGRGPMLDLYLCSRKQRQGIC